MKISIISGARPNFMKVAPMAGGIWPAFTKLCLTNLLMRNPTDNKTFIQIC